MLDRKRKLAKIGVVCVSGVLVVGAAGTTAYAKMQGTGDTIHAAEWNRMEEVRAGGKWTKESREEWNRTAGGVAIGKQMAATIAPPAEESENHTAGGLTEGKTIEGKLGEGLERIWQPGEESALTKEETVYIMAAADGSRSKVIVSDWIQNSGQADFITDRTELSGITEVKNDAGYVKQGDGYVWQAEGGDIYYQGTIDKELPLTLTVTYTLDGRRMEPEELEGKSGHMVIRYSFDVNECTSVEIGGAKERICVPFTAVTGMVLDNDVFRNVEVSSGRVVNDGDKTMVAGIAFPGMARNLDIEEKVLPGYVEVEADVTDFSLKTVYCVAMNHLAKNLNLDDADSMEDLTAALEELTDATDRLLDGSSQLYDGLATLYDKSGELKKGVGELYDGAGKLRDGAEKLAEGTETLQSGSIRLVDGAEQLQSGLGQLVSNNDSLNGGAKQVFETLLSTATMQMNSNGQLQQLGISVNLTMDNYDQVLNDILGSMDEAVLSAVWAEVNQKEPVITAGVTAAVEKQVRANVTPAVNAAVRGQVMDAVLQGMQEQGYPLTKEQYLAVKQGTVSGDDAQAAALVAMAAAADKAIEQQMATGQIQDTIDSKVEAAVGQQMGTEQIQATIAENVKAQKEKLVSDNLAAMSESLSAGAAQIAGLKQSLDSYNTFYRGLLTYTAGVASAKDGCDRLLDGAVSLKDGASQLCSGSGELYNGTAELYDGMGTLKEGSGALIDGVGQLCDGAKEMKDGLVKFDEEGIGKIADAFDGEEADMLLDRFRAIVDVSKAFRSYAGIAEDMDGNVKFIFKIDGIK